MEVRYTYASISLSWADSDLAGSTAPPPSPPLPLKQHAQHAVKQAQQQHNPHMSGNKTHVKIS